MNIIQITKNMLKDPYMTLCLVICSRGGVLPKLSDKNWTKVIWKLKTGKRIRLYNPKGFNEKLQWLKLYDRNPNYTMMVDKYLVRRFVADRVGEEYLVPLLGVWDSAEEIDFDQLPNQFVLKCNHNSGEGMCLCRDKSQLDIVKVKNGLNTALGHNYYFEEREWPYKNVRPRIIAEEYMVDTTIDNTRWSFVSYKFYCFNGEPKFFFVEVDDISNGSKGEAMLSFFDLEWKTPAFSRTDHAPIPMEVGRTDRFEEMVTIAKNLSANIPFVRVDLFSINNKVYFSEMTFYPGGGFGFFSPQEWEEKIGSWIKLPKRSQ